MTKNSSTRKSNATLAIKKAKKQIDTVNKLLAKKRDSMVVKEFNYRLQVSGGYQTLTNLVAVTSDGRYIVSVGTGETVKVWDIESGKEVRNFESDNGLVSFVATSQS